METENLRTSDLDATSTLPTKFLRNTSGREDQDANISNEN